MRPARPCLHGLAVVVIGQRSQIERLGPAAQHEHGDARDEANTIRPPKLGYAQECVRRVETHRVASACLAQFGARHPASHVVFPSGPGDGAAGASVGTHHEDGPGVDGESVFAVGARPAAGGMLAVQQHGVYAGGGEHACGGGACRSRADDDDVGIGRRLGESAWRYLDQLGDSGSTVRSPRAPRI